MNYANTFSSPRAWATERKSSASRDQILEVRIETVDGKVGGVPKLKRERETHSNRWPADRPSRRAGMEQSIEPSFFVGSASRGLHRLRIDRKSGQLRPRSRCPRYIIRWRLEVSFSSLRFRGECDQLFSLPTRFSREEAEEKGGAREVREKLPWLPSFFFQRGCAPLSPLRTRSLARSSAPRCSRRK